jgi:hypothetical protein
VLSAIFDLIGRGGTCGQAGLELLSHWSASTIKKVGHVDPGVTGVATAGVHDYIGLTAFGLTGNAWLHVLLAHEEGHHWNITPHEDVQTFAESCA